MSNEKLSNLSEIEQEFTREVRGEGSLSPYLAADEASGSNSGTKSAYVGYDIHPEDIEALYFEGMRVPRWESIAAESVAQQIEKYNEAMEKCLADYPLIGRVKDTDRRVDFDAGEVAQLRDECEHVLDATDDPKAIRAAQKFYLACGKAIEAQNGLKLVPSRSVY